MNAERLQIILFGKMCIRQGEAELSRFDSVKVLELLCYILINRGRPHLREVLCELLWSDLPDARAKKYLRQALWQLQAVLSLHGGSEEKSLLQVDANWVRVNQASDYWLDVAEFEQSYEKTRSIQGGELNQVQAEELYRASLLYSGDLLEGWYQDWCLFERERLHNVYISMLDKLVEYELYHQGYPDGIALCDKILRFDHAHERTHLRLMQFYYLSGDRTGALRQYQRCVAVLHDELRVKPSWQTIACYEQIQADTFCAPGIIVEGGVVLQSAALGTESQNDSTISRPSNRGNLLEDLYDVLLQIRTSLDVIQAQIRSEIDNDR